MTGADWFRPERTESQHSGRHYLDGASAAGEPRGPRPADGTGDFRESNPAEATLVEGTPLGRDEDPAGSDKHRLHTRAWWVEFPVLLCLALVLALIIKSFVVQAFFIPSSSMENTLDIGDKVLVNKLVYHFRPIERGDIVVFNGNGSWDPMPTQTTPPLVRLWNAITGLFGTAPGVHDYIKRVIAVPGDHVACCDNQGRLTVNGVPLNETSYLYPANAPSEIRFSVTVPSGRLWVMGDHRDVSADSRAHTNDPGDGTIPESRVVGRAFMIIIPVSRWRVLPIPATFQQPRLTGAADPAAPEPTSLAPAGAVPGHTGPASPAATALPLGLGFLGAVPLTWAQRRIRRRFGRISRRWLAAALGGRRRFGGFPRGWLAAVLGGRRRFGGFAGRWPAIAPGPRGRGAGSWRGHDGQPDPPVGGHGGSYRGMGL
jgi:signal peptidase I